MVRLSARRSTPSVYFLTSNYLCAIIAFVIARIVHRVNVQLKNAREIGSYRVIERIGAGGMGEVWRAQHRLLARPAAVELIRSSMLGESQRAREVLARRFEREARETAALGSIHTVAVYDFGMTEQGDFFYAMELLEGPQSRAIGAGIRSGGRRAERCTCCAKSVTRSERPMLGGLAHRDVKPANIMVCRLGPDKDFVKELDFGLVKHTAAERTLTMVSMEGSVVGTPGLHGAGNRARSSRTWTGGQTSTRWVASLTTCSPGNTCSRRTRQSRLPSRMCKMRRFRRGSGQNSRFLRRSMR